MSRLVLTLVVLAGTLAACGNAQPQPTPPTASPSVPGTAAPSSVQPDTSDSPSPSPSTPEPAVTSEPVEPTVAEQYLLDGIRRGAIDCQPVRQDLPPRATGGIECSADDPAVARVGFYLFEGEADLLEAYSERMNAEGVVRDSGSCVDGEGESAYVPGEGEVASRHGCFVNDEGYANYRATLPGSLLYIGVLGRTGDMTSLEDFAWRGNQDTPGAPTLWNAPED